MEGSAAEDADLPAAILNVPYQLIAIDQASALL